MDSQTITTGQVKWFNNHSGYGFITAIEGEQLGKDIFVHHSAIHGIDAPYKFLVEGEYVEFVLSTSTTGNHEFQAANITGIKGGSLMYQRQSGQKPQHYDSRVSRAPPRHGGRNGGGRGGRRPAPVDVQQDE
uniref:CSD domain-containing protein n=1 Tax=viral metagenome TaxID=1070528 RepID=A0A6C0I361_9ZZZZ